VLTREDSVVANGHTLPRAALVATEELFPFLDLKAQFATIRNEVMAAVTRVMDSQGFILGPEVSAFEEEIKPQVGCQHVFGCASGSDALLLALMALGVGPGDEVITVPFTFVATAGAIARLHARPVFVDIDPASYNLDAAQLEPAITPRTKAIIAVHLFGLSADMHPIMEVAARHGIPVIEDAAQAIGAKHKAKPVGSMGTSGCFSFFPSKNLGGAGDGGLVTTNDVDMAERLKLLRVHGSRRKYEYEIIGVNSRLDALQAAILRVKLSYLDRWTARRQHHADRYHQLFREHGLDRHIVLPQAPADCVHVYNQFTIRVRRRDQLKDFLKQRRVPSEIYYPFPLHLQPAFANLGYKPGSLPHSEAAAAEVLSLPIYPELTDAQLQAVVAAIADCYRGWGSSVMDRMSGEGKYVRRSDQ
jgi:dTDP-4-amino-4,6-dideoxygalactose transaminase